MKSLEGALDKKKGSSKVDSILFEDSHAKSVHDCSSDIRLIVFREKDP